MESRFSSLLMPASRLLLQKAAGGKVHIKLEMLYLPRWQVFFDEELVTQDKNCFHAFLRQ